MDSIPIINTSDRNGKQTKVRNADGATMTYFEIEHSKTTDTIVGSIRGMSASASPGLQGTMANDHKAPDSPASNTNMEAIDGFASSNTSDEERDTVHSLRNDHNIIESFVLF